jgi:hypothetical protein
MKPNPGADSERPPGPGWKRAGRGWIGPGGGGFSSDWIPWPQGHEPSLTVESLLPPDPPYMRIRFIPAGEDHPRFPKADRSGG